MKSQQIFDKNLKDRVVNLEMEPPADLFERIAPQGMSSVQGELSWYKRSNFQRAIAVVVLLLVAGALLISPWLKSEQIIGTVPVAAYDTMRRVAATEQLLALEEAVRLQSEIVDFSPEFNPKKQQSSRLAANSINVKLPQEGLEPMNRPVLALESMKSKILETLPAKRPGLNVTFEWRLTERLPASIANLEAVAQARKKPLSQLQEGRLFTLAKEHLAEFKTKEHYVSFHLGSLEIGQTIQLSKPEQ